MAYSRSYAKFFKTKFWSEIRKKVLQRDNNQCQRCGAAGTLDIHHYYYPLNPYDIELCKLVALCRSCHKIADKERLTNPAKRYKYEK